MRAMPPSSLCRSFGAALGTLALLLSLAACGDSDYRLRAVGPEGEVTVVMDSAAWNDSLGAAVRAQIAPLLATLPAPEPTFDLRQTNLATQDDLDRIKRRKNVLFVAPINDSSQVANFMRDRYRNHFSEEEQQAVRSGAIIEQDDPWRRDQRVFYATAPTPEALVATLRDQGAEVRRTFNAAERRRMQREMFEKARQTNLEDSLMQRHGFAVNVQHDYVIATDTTGTTAEGQQTGFVWLRRILSETWRSLFVYYVEDADSSVLSPAWVYATRDSLTQQYVRGEVAGFAKTDQRFPDQLITEPIDFLGRSSAYETRGLWYMSETGSPAALGGGGPFVNYAFYDPASRRLYMIDGMVFAPNYDKREFLRQMEVIAYTFRTRQEVQQPGEASEETVATRAE